MRFHTVCAIPEIKTRNGLRVSSVPQMLIEVAPHETRRELRPPHHPFGAQGDPRPGPDAARPRPPRGPARGGEADDRTKEYLPRPDRKSHLEVAFDEFLAQHPEIPEPERNIYIDGWEIDCYWPEQRLAVELDGRPYHVAVKDMERDRVKDAKLLLKRINVMRITDTRFELDPRGVFDDLLAALGLAPAA